MTVQSVVQEVCSFVGVRPPNGSIFASPYLDRTGWEFVNLANEMAQCVAYDTRDWTALVRSGLFVGDSTTASFPLPPDFKRLLLNSEVWRVPQNPQPMSFISDPNDWMRRRTLNLTSSQGEWIIMGDHMTILPHMPAGTFAEFMYLDKNCVRQDRPGTFYSDTFQADGDRFRLNERLLKLAMVWRWKANKGASYAEDLANYEDALSRVAGVDKPSPIIIDGKLRSMSDFDARLN